MRVGTDISYSLLPFVFGHDFNQAPFEDIHLFVNANPFPLPHFLWDLGKETHHQAVARFKSLGSSPSHLLPTLLPLTFLLLRKTEANKASHFNNLLTT